MVLLTTAAVIAGLSIILFVIGLVLDRPEIALFGAIIMIGVGGTGVVQGYQVETGTRTTIVKSTVALENIGESDLVQSKVLAQDANPTGIDFRPDGTNMYVSGDENDAIYQYDSGDHDLSIATFNRSFDVSAQDATPTGVEFKPDGTRMYVTGDDTDTIYQYDLSEPWNVSTASLSGSFDVSTENIDPRAMDWDGAGEHFYVVDDTGLIHEYEASTAYDVSTPSIVQQFDVSSQEATPTGIDFSVDGTRMVVTGEDSDTMYGYALTTAYDLSTASYTGHSLSLGRQRPSGVAYEADGTKLFVTNRKGGEADQWDSSTVSTAESTEKTYEDVESISSFPLEIVILLLGAIMLISGAGEASETGREEPPWRRRD